MMDENLGMLRNSGRDLMHGPSCNSLLTGVHQQDTINYTSENIHTVDRLQVIHHCLAYQRVLCTTSGRRLILLQFHNYERTISTFS